MAWVIVLACVAAAALYTFVMARAQTRAKQELRCIVCRKQATFSEILKELDRAGIYYSLQQGSASQEAYDQAGAAQRSPLEIWIPKDDFDRAKNLIQSKHLTETSKSALIVH